MGYQIPNQGDSHMMSGAFRGSANLYLELISSAATLTAHMTPTAVTALTAGGYTGLMVHVSAWCAPYLTAGSGEVSASGNDPNGFKFTFTAAPNQSAVGYSLWNTAANTLIVVETFASSYYLQNAGDTLTIKPKVRGT